MSIAPKELNVVPEPTEDIQNSNESIQNLIAILRLCEQIQTSKENVEKNSESGECNDGIIVTY